MLNYHNTVFSSVSEGWSTHSSFLEARFFPTVAFHCFVQSYFKSFEQCGYCSLLWEGSPQLTNLMPGSILIWVFGKGLTPLVNQARLEIAWVLQSECSQGKIDLRESYLPAVGLHGLLRSWLLLLVFAGWNPVWAWAMVERSWNCLIEMSSLKELKKGDETRYPALQ